MTSDKRRSGEQQPLPVTTDARFARIHSDPRFARPRKDASKLTIDSRFASMLTAPEFGTAGHAPKVDKYGRRKKTTKSKELLRFYKLDREDEHKDDDSQQSKDDDDESTPNASDEEQELDVSDQDDDSQDEDDEETIQGFDLARGEGLLESDSEFDEDDDEVVLTLQGRPRRKPGTEEDVIDVGPYAEANVPTGEETRRIAVVNMDWDHVRARDLYKVFDGFRPKTGTIRSVKIYLSEFGKERVDKEAREGPPREIFTSTTATDSVPKKNAKKTKSSDPESSLVSQDAGDEFDSQQLRKYQIERLRYYYAVVECDTVDTARAIYQSCDGTEYESSANFFDLRYVPDDMSFDDEPKDVATDAPIAGYRPAEFTTRALQHSKVELTWDVDDPERMRVMRRKFTKEDLRDMDFKTYLASSSSEEEEDEKDDGSDEESVAALRAKYRALLNGDKTESGKNAGRGNNSDSDDQDMQITFTPGLSEKASQMLERRKQEEAHKNENVYESYLRKRREKRKEKKAAAKNGHADDQESNDDDLDEAKILADEDDDFFATMRDDADHDAATSLGKNKSRDEKRANRERRKQDAEREAKERAELELLLMDDTANSAAVESRHYDMKAIIKDEQASQAKGKKKRVLLKKQQKRRMRGAEDAVQDDFHVDVSDPRFSAVVESHHFAIDPTNPNFKKTRGMETLLAVRRKKLASETEGGRQDCTEPKKVAKNDNAVSENQSDKKDTSLEQLVASVKRKSENALQRSGQGKRAKPTNISK